MWHIDGCDKLKPFGFPIHRAIDNFSRKILWLNICPSNKDPYIISCFNINCNVSREQLEVVGAVKMLLGLVFNGIFTGEHQDSTSGHSSFLFGSSTNNQRIESWRSILKRQSSAWWISFFIDLGDESLFDLSLSYHMYVCMYFII